MCLLVYSCFFFFEKLKKNFWMEIMVLLRIYIHYIYVDIGVVSPCVIYSAHMYVCVNHRK